MRLSENREGRGYVGDLTDDAEGRFAPCVELKRLKLTKQ